ncbi:SDR family NAD(P)-dependent oxidoreductase [Halopelagius longus]|uniref:NAD(P)-dependent dehydrogenase, short-chain alcohol dehydrogenase family n=1 Tax=Halopelagius longus TaxID=1236180 RepID=A0A1H1G622_9EURY|nr:SDR family NAD(P)-dependent oxidoreductase [Halopelagius longus]RDI69820.1 SDR family oxidoreductase [Halopelagius longus]SDR08684.1 NAD(P)-dependent dehydrogenase, short-chain alcohol dehydrogenase family [Halopelagius longus]
MTAPTANAVEGRHEERVVLVTGSTRGIGEGVARRFAAEGASVVVNGRSRDAGEAVADSIRAEGGEATFVPADMRDPAEIEALIDHAVEEYGRIDVLVNNAGVQTETTAEDATMDDWEFVVETDFRSFWLCSKHAAERMPEGGRIVNMSSNHAYLTMPGLFPYNAVKAGINGMTRALALELGPRGITVNTINPGWIEIARTQEELGDRYEYTEEIHPVGRLGTPADVAGMAAFLASEDASFVTGESILVDGGRTAVMQDEIYRDYRSQVE